MLKEDFAGALGYESWLDRLRDVRAPVGDLKRSSSDEPRGRDASTFQDRCDGRQTVTGHGRLTIMYSFDCRDAAALAQFWSRVLERPVDQGATAAYATIGFDDEGPTWMFVRSEELAEDRNRLMLDFAGERDWLQEADRAEGLGARRVADHQMDGVRWVELRDPENNTFRIFAPRPQ